MSEHGGETPDAVPVRAKRAGEVREQHWAWTEPTVWTERMLAALQVGVKGGKWYSLIDKVCSENTLQAAFARVEANEGAAGVDHISVDRYGRDLDANLKRLSEELRTGTYRPQSIRRHYIAKPGSREKRPLFQQAVLQVLQAEWDPTFSEHSFGFRRKRSAHQAVARAQELIASGHDIVVDLDLEKFFDRVNYDILMGLVVKRVADKRVLKLIRGFLTAGVLMDGLAGPTEEGTPQGGPLAPRTQKITSALSARS